jgi:EAL domain-containing protein (putative c-di-GMP-specific phosphodiesterase class I)/GGDEF domain-containing protein
MFNWSILAIEDVLFVGLITAAAVAAMFFLARSIRKERLNYFENLSEEKLQTEDVKKFVSKRMSAGTKRPFALYQLDIYDGASLQKNLGDVQMNNLISELVQRIRGIVSESAQIFVEGQTLYIFIRDLTNPQQLEFFAKLIIEEAKRPFVIVGSLKIDIDINICVATYPQSGKKFSEFMHNLDLAMIAAKRMGLNTFKIYDKQLSNEETAEYKHFKEVKEAIANKDFTLFYQPIMDISKNSIVAVESLLRWNHKKMGILPPSKFLDILEHSGDIYWVGLWAFEQLVKQHQQTKVMFPDKNIIFSMNISPKQLLNPSLSAEFKRLLVKHRAEANDFCLEIVEFAMFDKIEEVQQNITKLRQMGFLIAIDDYALDFSRLSELDSLPVDVIKLSQKFFAKEGSFTRNVAEMLNKFAAESDIMVIAQGVEDEKSVETAKNLNIKYGQGYYFYKPKSFEELLASIKSNIAATEEL